MKTKKISAKLLSVLLALCLPAGGMGIVPLAAAEEICTCRYRCSPEIVERTWQGNKTYVTRTEDCPVCGGENGDWENGCRGEQIVADGDPSHDHTWKIDWGIQGHVPANCTTPEAWILLDNRCGAEWLFAFDPDGERDLATHYFSDHKPKVKEATCTQDGASTRTCLLCGEKVVTPIPAKGHTYAAGTLIIDREATCMEDGQRHGYCTACEEEVTERIPAAGGHTKPETGVQTTAATCTRDGYTAYTCTVCQSEVREAIPKTGHTWPSGDSGTKGVCTTCGAQAYRVYTYEEGAAPSGTGYEIELCARVIQEAGGTVYGVDAQGNRLEGGSFAVKINEALMGKVKPRKGEDGGTVMTRVAGYRSMDDKDGTLYSVGAAVRYEEVPGLFGDFAGSWSRYYSTNSWKAVFLEAVREELDPFQTHIVPYTSAPVSNPSLRTDILKTSDGITADLAYNETHTACVITYTIPAGYAGGAVHIDASNDVMEAYRTIQEKRFGAGLTQPGDTLGPVSIRLVNQSGQAFSYADGSFVLQSPSHDGASPYIAPGYTFDGVLPPEGSVPSRVSNGALRYLYGSQTDVSREQLGDEALGARLRAKGYRGVEELHQYYLDYYNHHFSTEEGAPWHSLRDIPYALLVQRDTGIFGGQSSTAGVKETNPEVAGAGYSYMYTRLLSVIPGDSGKDEDGRYAVSRYMDRSVSFEDSAKAAWSALRPGGEAQLDGMSLHVNGEANNVYQNTAWGIEIGFSLYPVPDSPPPVPGGEDVPEPDIPLTPPDSGEDVPEPDVPLTPPDGGEEIEDPVPPLADSPKTGDGGTRGFIAALYSLGLLALTVFRKKQKENIG